jgi:hypothetical protein
MNSDYQIVQNMTSETSLPSLTHTDKISDHFDISKNPTSDPMSLTNNKKNPSDSVESVYNTNNYNNMNRNTQATISSKSGQTTPSHSSRFGDRSRSRSGSPSDNPQVSPFDLLVVCDNIFFVFMYVDHVFLSHFHNLTPCYCCFCFCFCCFCFCFCCCCCFCFCCCCCCCCCLEFFYLVERFGPARE